MRALTVTELSGPSGVRVGDAPEPQVADRVLVEVRAVGISFPDLLRSQGLYQVRDEIAKKLLLLLSVASGKPVNRERTCVPIENSCASTGAEGGAPPRKGLS